MKNQTDLWIDEAIEYIYEDVDITYHIHTSENLIWFYPNQEEIYKCIIKFDFDNKLIKVEFYVIPSAWPNLFESKTIKVVNSMCEEFDTLFTREFTFKTFKEFKE